MGGTVGLVGAGNGNVPNCCAGIVNLSGRGMLLVSVTRQLGSGNSFARLLRCPPQAKRVEKRRPRSAKVDSALVRDVIVAWIVGKLDCQGRGLTGLHPVFRSLKGRGSPGLFC